MMREVAEESAEEGVWSAEGEEASLLGGRIIYGSPLTNNVMSTSSILSTNTCSSAVTPRFSNVTIDDEDEFINPPPRVPSMNSTSSHQKSNRPKKSRVPPPRQAAPLHRNGSSNNNAHPVLTSTLRSVSKKQVLKASRSSHLKTSTTLIVLVIGLFLAACTLFQYFVRGPDSFDLNPNLDTTNNDGHTTIAQAMSGGSVISGIAKLESSKEVEFDEFGRYIIEDYDAHAPFSDILPGVAGIYGKPLYVFYVNRGQGIASFGVKSKEFPIMEYYSANNAYQNTAMLGFRTFYKGRRDVNMLGKKSHEFLVEPFDSSRTRFSQLMKSDLNEQGESKFPTRRMFIGANDMTVQEVDMLNKIETNVTYFNMPEENFGAFVKRTTISNLDEKDALHLSVLDGLARIQPAGGKLETKLKLMGRTLEGFMGVEQAGGDGDLTMPFFRMSEIPDDAAAVVVEEAGNFCLSYIENEEKNLLPIVYDTNKVFGEDTSLLRPMGLYEKSVKDILKEKQYGASRTSSAFAAVDDVTIWPGQHITITSFYGKADMITELPVIARRIAQGGFAQYKLSRARALIQQITTVAETVTADHIFDKHVEQMILDNSLMGGIPVLLGDVDVNGLNADDDERIKVYHLFSRRGDLERDYDKFVIENTYFSEGPSSFRDVIQNRRNDVVFNPRVGAFNFNMFLSLIQADGYNPTSVEAIVFSIDDPDECLRLATNAVGYADGHRAQREGLASMLCDGEFRPGQLLEMIQQQNIFLMTSLASLIEDVAASSKVLPSALTSGDGFYADHWTYLMDMLSSYLQIYPDREEHLLFNKKLTYYFSPRVVSPRKRKYVLSKSYNGQWMHVRQLDATYESGERYEYMRKYMSPSSGWYVTEASIQHDSTGNIFKSTAIEKLWLLATIKFATRDPFGMGIEYEAGKPGWNTALNGISSMLGSGLPETYELKILLQYIHDAVVKFNRSIFVPKELAVLVEKILNALNALDELGDEECTPKQDSKGQFKVPSPLFHYWDVVATAREEYRADVTLFSGETHEYSPVDIATFSARWIEQIDLGIARAHVIGSHGHEQKDSGEITPTYFSYNVTKWEETGERNQEGHPFCVAKEMVVGRFPLFLEGVTRVMKTMDKEQALSLYEYVKQSGLRDSELKMYTLSSSLVGQSYDMGRMMGFSPGWLENQSVWTDQSYKYYLELIKKGMYAQFFEEMRNGMLPFIDGQKYGRSVMECSSFIASSVFEDPNVRGRGVLARLSGSAAEFLNIWKLMFIGENLFQVNEDGSLEMQLVPSLPAWLFKENEHQRSPVDDQYAIRFKLFTSINVAYFVSTPKDLFDMKPSRYTIGLRDGSTMKVDGSCISSTLATNIRKVVFIDYIHAYF